MKFATAISRLFLVLIPFGCTGAPAPVSQEPTASPLSPMPTDTIIPSASDTPIPTAAETLVPSATPMAFLEPTQIVNPENLKLAATGYDIADVRYSYPREDRLVVNFKYQLDESRTSKDTYIFMIIPPRCRGNDYQYFPPHFVAKALTGEGEFAYKMTLQGVCDADSIEFAFYPVLEHPGPPYLYSEHVQQPYYLVRSFPTLNSDTIQLRNFQFTPQVNWRGVFSFDYAISEEIPLQLERYYMVLRSFGPDGGCPSYSDGPLITEHQGTYQIPLYLPEQLISPYASCLSGLEKYTYTRSGLYVEDILGGTDVYYHDVNFPYTVWMSP